MSEDDDLPKKKAARKASSKKSTSKKASSQKAKSSPANEESMPLIPEVMEEQSGAEDAPKPRKKKAREPKSVVRDVREEPGDESEAEAPKKKPAAKEKSEGAKGGDKSSADSEGDSENRGRQRGRGRGRRGGDRERDSQPRVKVEVDEDQLKKKAWKIYLSEVTEEGLALLDDAGMRNLAKGSIQAARIYLEEEKRIG